LKTLQTKSRSGEVNRLKEKDIDWKNMRFKKNQRLGGGGGLPESFFVVAALQKRGVEKVIKPETVENNHREEI